MKLLLLGGGGREHALAWRIRLEHPDATLIVAPGNPGIARLPGTTCVPIDLTDVPAMLALAHASEVDAVIVGPESPLAAGFADACLEAGIPVFGPTAAAAQLETSKAFAKELMRSVGVPTGRASMHTTVASAKAAARDLGAPVVIKASGLAAGKGVVVAMTIEEADAAITSMLQDNVFGDAGAEVLVEEYMTGEELSLFVLTDGEIAVPLPPAQDYKRVNDGDLGPNTGGMGAYCPADAGDTSYTWKPHGKVPKGVQFIIDTIVAPTLRAMRERNTPFTGLLYCGVMLTPTGPRVIEFNCRFGDPETQAVLPTLGAEARLISLMVQIARGERIDPAPVFSPASFAVATVVAAPGYPMTPITGQAIRVGEKRRNSDYLFHAGTAIRDGVLVTSGGRVMTATTQAEALDTAQDWSLRLASEVKFPGAFFRKDIGLRALSRGA